MDNKEIKKPTLDKVKEESEKIINSIKNFFKILVTLVAKSVTSLFGIEKKEIKIDNR